MVIVVLSSLVGRLHVRLSLLSLLDLSGDDGVDLGHSLANWHGLLGSGMNINLLIHGGGTIFSIIIVISTLINILNGIAHLHLLIFGGLVLSRGSGSLALGGGSSSSCGLSGSGCLGSSNNRGGSSSMVAEVRNMASVMTSGLGMIILEMMAGELTVSRVVHLLNITIDPWDAEFVELVGSVVGVVLDTIAILINDIALEVHILGGNVDLINVVDETEVDSGASLDHSLVGDVAGGSLHLGLDLVTVDLLSERNGINIAFLVLVGGLLLGLLVVGVKDVLNLDGRNIVD